MIIQIVQRAILLDWVVSDYWTQHPEITLQQIIFQLWILIYFRSHVTVAIVVATNKQGKNLSAITAATTTNIIIEDGVSKHDKETTGPETEADWRY